MQLGNELNFEWKLFIKESRQMSIFLLIALFLYIGNMLENIKQKPVVYFLENNTGALTYTLILLPLFLCSYTWLIRSLFQLKKYFFERNTYIAILSQLTFWVALAFSALYGTITFLSTNLAANGHFKNLTDLNGWSVWLVWVVIITLYLWVAALVYNCVFNVFNRTTIAVIGTVVILNMENFFDFFVGRSYLLAQLPNVSNTTNYLHGDFLTVGLSFFAVITFLILVQNGLVSRQDWRD